MIFLFCLWMKTDILCNKHVFTLFINLFRQQSLFFIQTYISEIWTKQTDTLNGWHNLYRNVNNGADSRSYYLFSLGKIMKRFVFQQTFHSSLKKWKSLNFWIGVLLNFLHTFPHTHTHTHTWILVNKIHISKWVNTFRKQKYLNKW